LTGRNRKEKRIQTGKLIGTATIGTGHGARPEADSVVERYLCRNEDLGWHVPAWKVARLAIDDDGHKVFLPLTGKIAYGRDSEARCYLGCGSEAPNLDCSCGFYAVLDRRYLEQYFGWRSFATLEVAMTGRVAFFGGAYAPQLLIIRAQYQHIVSYKVAVDGYPPIQSGRRTGREEDGGSLARPYHPRHPDAGPERIQVPTPDWLLAASEKPPHRVLAGSAA
jgi:hypothetical protein